MISLNWLGRSLDRFFSCLRFCFAIRRNHLSPARGTFLPCRFVSFLVYHGLGRKQELLFCPSLSFRECRYPHVLFAVVFLTFIFFITVFLFHFLFSPLVL